MAIAPGDILFRYSTKAGSAGNTNTSSASQSLGKYVSTTAVTAGANNLFDDVSGSENSELAIDYRCIFVLNNHASLTLQNAVVYISSEVSGGTNVQIAVDNIVASDKGSATAQADDISDESAAPDAVGSFSAPATAGSGLALGNLAPGQVRAVWLRREATNSAAVTDGLVLGINGDTAP